MSKSRMLWRSLGCLAVLLIAGCGGEPPAEPTQQGLAICIAGTAKATGSDNAGLAPAPACLVTCATDPNTRACTAATAGQPCKKADGTQGTCNSTYSGCLCQ